MHILHISSDFSYTKVHTNLYQQLDKLGVEQTIFNPIRLNQRNIIGRNEFEAEHTNFVYADVVKPFHRYTYHIKRHVVFHALQNKVDLIGVNMVHAATLFTDGGQAYKVFKKYHIPYVVAVRNTDINGFLDKLPNTWISGLKILCNAKLIFFISKALMDKFSNHKVIKPIIPKIKDKMVLIPNGIDDYFVDHIVREPHRGHRVLYVGNFSGNKNVLRLGKAVFQLRNEENFHDTTLTLVGGGCDSNGYVKKMIDSHPNIVHFLGPIYDKSILCDVFRTHSVFAMPSITETFGLVYLEALSQNTPIIFTRGQGVDGLFDDSVGIGVDPLSVEDIKCAIKKILISQEKYSNSTINFEEFRWQYVAEKYLSFYKLFIK
jgi:glycosyltransferase involved in cell wall biosynthesis